jgi:hypothetical protein
VGENSYILTTEKIAQIRDNLRGTQDRKIPDTQGTLAQDTKQRQTKQKTQQ